ncbi:methyltransferase domain-containing protein [Lachnospiraceae bacterium C1.1]|nr:bifunctional glycosyltransferase/class I SAM-dependent methyltransferase [Lachnospiraceae bacterium C1.1]
MGVLIIILSCNEIEKTKLCLESIRCAVEYSYCHIIIADNDSSDGTVEWAVEQKDVTVYEIRDEIMPWGKVINSIIEDYGSDQHVMIIEARSVLVPGALTGMLSVLDERSAVICPINFSGDILTIPDNVIESYDDALKDVREKGNSQESGRAMELHTAAALFHKNIFEKVGKFDERLFTLKYIYKDFSIRMLQDEFEIRVAKNCFVYEIEEEIIYTSLLEADRLLMKLKYGMNYFNMISNGLIVRHLLDNVSRDGIKRPRILEIGCDLGATLFAIGEKISDSELYGIELNGAAAKIARNVADVLEYDVEKEKLEYEDEFFDYMIFGDVLEHLHNPEKTLGYLKRFLKDNGKIIASIPNLMHISVIKELLKGNFEYTDCGLLDRTHIHLFTYNEIVKMLDRLGFKKYDILSKNEEINENDKELIRSLLVLQPEAKEFMYSSFQYLVIACK